ncbi:MAG TPA: hypothetical protein VFO91_16280 [Anaerolineales bacterium]|nr:hypothetical protein [Anaerolineales bacterium]
MSYRTIKTPEISGSITVHEVELVALDMARRLKEKLRKAGKPPAPSPDRPKRSPGGQRRLKKRSRSLARSKAR